MLPSSLYTSISELRVESRLTPGQSADRQPPPTSIVTVVIFSRRLGPSLLSHAIRENGKSPSSPRATRPINQTGRKRPRHATFVREGDLRRRGEEKGEGIRGIKRKEKPGLTVRSQGFLSRSTWFYLIDRTFLARSRFPYFVQRSIILDEFLCDFLHFARLFFPLRRERNENTLWTKIWTIYIYMYIFCG